MRVVRAVAQMTACLTRLKAHGARQGRDPRVGLVPTMGALHEGHLSLIRRARRENELVVVSLFVNPIQFGPREDYRRYPRDLKRDLTLLKDAGVDLVFAPSVRQMYPRGFQTSVEVTRLSQGLCGSHRPGHFRGVATVVTKLFNIIRPDRAYVGQKDLQQARIIQHLVRDLNLPIQVKVLPTAREFDGLAMSSRHRYLTDEERRQAPIISRALNAAKKAIYAGVRDPRAIRAQIRRALQACPVVSKIEYVAIVHARDLTPLKHIRGEVAIACAVWIGSTRLIDNLVVNL